VKCTVPRWKNVLQTSEEVYRLKRNAVLREATRIIGRRGYHNTSLDDIAESLQVAKGTLYNYVKDKQEILLECHKMALDIGDQAFAFAEEHGHTGYSKLRLMLRAYLTWLNGALGGGGVVSDVTALRAADQKAVVARRDGVEKRLVAYFQEGFKDGTIREVDARIAVYTIMGAINAVQGWFAPGGRLSMEEITVLMVDILMHGVDTEADATYVDAPVPPYGSIDVVKLEPVTARRETPARRSAAAELVPALAKGGRSKAPNAKREALPAANEPAHKPRRASKEAKPSK
jgi:AcrR family transcriptional regulator